MYGVCKWKLLKGMIHNDVKSLKTFLSSTAVGQTLQEKKVSTPSTNCKNGPPPKKKKTLHKKKYATT